VNPLDTSDLSHLRALVTGGGSGIGAAIVEALRDAGANVFVTDIDSSLDVDHHGDVSSTDDVDSLFAAVDPKLGGLDVLVNNVGIAGQTALIDEVDPEAFDRDVQVNLGSAMRCTRLATPLLRAAGGGLIVNISSTAGIYGYPYRSSYVAAKWGVVGLTKTWAMELGADNIRVNCICPGTVGGPRMDGVIGREAQARSADPEAIRAGYANQVSLRTFMSPYDIAGAVVYMASPAGRYVSGQVLSVDGSTESMRTL
jgi:NAD(P)-dependent dehydrogenase (short-subunit alcohol dehydrogenase family)